MTKLELEGLLDSNKGLLIFLVSKALPTRRQEYFDRIASMLVEIPK